MAEGNEEARNLLDAQNVTVRFNVSRMDRSRSFYALSAVSLAIAAGEIHGLVGESGSGKSTLARAVIGLQPIDSGAVVFDGRLLGPKRSREDRRAIQMVFQDPYASLDPRLTVRSMLREVLLRHHIVSRSGLDDRCGELMSMVQLPGEFLDARPVDMSGGQRQRVVIARSLAINPRLLIADEAVAALDVSVQAGIINLLIDLRDQKGIAILFIAHNLAVVRSMCDRISVIYHGRIVEEASRDELYSNPIHPYTCKLLEAVPRLDGRRTILSEPDDRTTVRLPDGETATILDPDSVNYSYPWTLLSLDGRRDHFVAASKIGGMNV